jgi:ribosomal protein L11 methyltransferase
LNGHQRVSTQELIEVSICDVNDQAAQSVVELFDRWSWGGAVLEQVADARGRASSSIKAYLSAQNREALRQIEIGLALLGLNNTPQCPLPPLHVRMLAETDWAEAWKAHYQVLHIGRRLVVKPSWLEYDCQGQEVVIELDPGMAFGSGLHATTRLCLELLEDAIPPGGSVLDVGTGSGILAIAAGKLGAARVLALDIDPVAIEVACENVRLNGLEAVVDARLGTLAPLQQGQWDTVLANILAETIVDMAPMLADSLTPGGILIVSGIIGERADMVVGQLHTHRLQVAERRDDGDWVAFAAVPYVSGQQGDS